MKMISAFPALHELESRVLYHAEKMGRTLPEIRFFVLDAMEFMSLLEKKVYPTSPVNIWEGKRMLSKKHRVESGQESALYYEVVQTGDPSYAYLNATNNDMMQASVMAHVVGHCEFSELNVLRDSNRDRTEYVMHLVRRTDQGRQQMGHKQFSEYWNALESVSPLIAPNSQYNLAGSVDTDLNLDGRFKKAGEPEQETKSALMAPYSETMDLLLRHTSANRVVEQEARSKRRQQALNRKGYKLRAPCQDVLGFLRNFAPASRAERDLLEYVYTVHAPQDFVVRTQIMNEGWAMYWEKKIMLELFKERAVKGIIEYAKVFSGVCYPRPYFMRNPYHLGFHLWTHIEDLYRHGKVSLDFKEEVDLETRSKWDRGVGVDPMERLLNLVKTTTDYEFLRRFLTPELIHEFHLNRIPQRDAARLGISRKDIVQENKQWVWLDPEPIHDEMLRFFTHFYRPRIYIIDTDFEDGGLLLFHRDDGRRLKVDWVKPTLKNLNMIWKGSVFLVSRGTLYGYTTGRYREMRIGDLSFDQVIDRMQAGTRPFEVQ